MNWQKLIWFLLSLFLMLLLLLLVETFHARLLCCYLPLLVYQTNASPKLSFAIVYNCIALVATFVALPSVGANLEILSIKREHPA